MATATTKKIVLVTGANSGIGFELAAQLMAKGSYHVLVGSRSVEKGNAALQELQGRKLPGSAEMIPLDVTKDETIESAAASVQKNHGKLDIIVNNAGAVPQDPPLRQQMRESFDVNATGPAVVVSMFADLLKKSTSSPRIVNVSSGVGSIGQRLNRNSPTYKIDAVQYRASKAALSMVTACQFAMYEPDGIKVFAYCPGFTVSSLSANNTAENGARSTAESVKSLMDVVEGRRDDEAGLFLHNTGTYPW